MKQTCKLDYQERISIITDAIETRAIQYWAYEELGTKILVSRDKDGNIYKAIVTIPHPSNDGSSQELTINSATVQKGIDLILSNGEGCEVRDDIRESIVMNDNDSESCDCIIQAGLFGRIIYG